MTKKDYELLARVIGATREESLKYADMAPSVAVEGVISKLLVRLCTALKQENSRFDEDRFYEAVYRK